MYSIFIPGGWVVVDPGRDLAHEIFVPRAACPAPCVRLRNKETRHQIPAFCRDAHGVRTY